jgi:hypothetical protein
LYGIKKIIKEKESLELRSVCIDLLSNTGFMSVDDGFPGNNFEYQYAALVVKRVESELREKRYGNKYPLSGIASFVKNSLGSGYFYEQLMDKGIDLLDIESSIRKDIWGD